MARSRNFQQSRGNDRNHRDIDAYLVRESFLNKVRRREASEIDREPIEVSESDKIAHRILVFDRVTRFKKSGYGVRPVLVPACFEYITTDETFHGEMFLLS